MGASGWRWPTGAAALAGRGWPATTRQGGRDLGEGERGTGCGGSDLRERDERWAGWGLFKSREPTCLVGWETDSWAELSTPHPHALVYTSQLIPLD